uniref:Uncharacterized protein n=1 Tax=Anguilla anguilla TaxID=7936 RepID=A0A0E9PHH9_ANGAN
MSLPTVHTVPHCCHLRHIKQHFGKKIMILDNGDLLSNPGSAVRFLIC